MTYNSKAIIFASNKYTALSTAINPSLRVFRLSQRYFMGEVYMSSKVVRSEGLEWKRGYNVCGKIYWKLCTVLFTVVLFTVCTRCILRCRVCIVVNCLMCIVVVVLCVLLWDVSCVLLLVVLCVLLLLVLCVLLFVVLCVLLWDVSCVLLLVVLLVDLCVLLLLVLCVLLLVVLCVFLLVVLCYS